jgi:carbon-monoxide dehydrogenase small subunit
MKIEFILNGDDVSLQRPSGTLLIDILREDFSLTGTKAGCVSGKCGLCAVLLNGKISHACLVPAFKLQGSEVITIEGFALTDEYHDAAGGFERAGLEDCGYCRSARFLTAGSVLNRNRRPSWGEILRLAGDVKCRCTDPLKFAEGIKMAIEERQRRLSGKSS